MRRALVIGAGGFVGSRLVAQLAARDWDVQALALPGTPQLPGACVRTLHGDRHDPGLLRQLLAHDVDAVFDLVAYRAADSAALAAAAEGRAGRLVHLSSVSVYGAYPAQGAADEAALPLLGGDAGGYGGAKAACERLLERLWDERRLPSVRLRAAPLFGKGDPCSREAWFLKRIAAGAPILHPGPADGRLWMLHVDDLVRACLDAAAAGPEALGQAFHLAHEDAPTLAEHVGRLAQGIGRPAPRLETVPAPELARRGLHVYAFAHALAPAAAPSSAAARALLGWQPRSYEAALADWFAGVDRASVATLPAWPGRAAMQARLCGTHEWLHAAREARVLAGQEDGAPAPDAATLLDWLAGGPQAPGAPRFFAAHEWEAQAHAAAGPCLVLPADLLARLRDAWPAAQAPRPAATRLCGVVEHDPWRPGLAWLFDDSPAPPRQEYGLSARPVALRVLGYAQGMRGVPDDAQLLLTATAADDASALAGHVDACARRGLLELDELAQWARIRVVGAPRIEGEDGFWRGSHALARLLVRAGLAGPACLYHVDALPAAALCAVGGRWYVADGGAGRVVEVDPAIARVLRFPDRSGGAP